MSFENFGRVAGGILVAGCLGIGVAGCPMEDDESDTRSNPPDVDSGAAVDASPATDAQPDAGSTPAATHTGIVSIQDIEIANLPVAGHGLTVVALFTPTTAPDYEATTGTTTDCRAWSYDVTTKPPPPEQDHGELRVRDVRNGPLSCRFVASRGYVCPTAAGSAEIVVGSPTGPTVALSVPGGTFGPSDVGRYMQLTGAASAGNNGAFAIVGVVSPSEIIIANPGASTETFTAAYTVLAGAGPTPNDLFDPFVAGAKVTIGLVAGAGAALDIPDTAITPGEAFVLDDASKPRIMNIPVTGEATTLACASCGAADATVIRITATDADVTGVSPVAMPAPKKKLVEIQCVRTGPGAESITVPTAAMDLIRAAHAVSPITRIRTAFMREGVASVTNAAPKPPNVSFLLVGHGVLGFTKP